MPQITKCWWWQWSYTHTHTYSYIQTPTAIDMITRQTILHITTSKKKKMKRNLKRKKMCRKIQIFAELNPLMLLIFLLFFLFLYPFFYTFFDYIVSFLSNVINSKPIQLYKRDPWNICSDEYKCLATFGFRCAKCGIYIYTFLFWWPTPMPPSLLWRTAINRPSSRWRTLLAY